MANKMLWLADMQPNMAAFSAVALIISKSEPNIFLDKHSSEYRGVISFTLRDTKRHIVNCKCWGSKDVVNTYNEQLHMGDVVDVVGAKVMPLCAPNGAERYQPQATLRCALVVNEGHGFLQPHKEAGDVEKVEQLLQLRHMPHKPICSALKLADVRSGVLEQRLAQYVDLVVVVASLRPVRQIKRKVARVDGQELLHCLELVVCDASWPDGMVLTLWHGDWIQRATQFWQPRKTILHLIDVRIAYSDFYAAPALSHAACTLIYENPPGEECQKLLAFAATVPGQQLDIIAQAGLDNLPPAAEIKTQMTVKQIYARAEGDLRDAATEQFTAVLYAMVSKFDIDGHAQCISKKCKVCQRLIPRNHIDCDNEACQLDLSLSCSGPRYENFLNINMQLTDHTGTLIEPRLSGGVAEHLLGHSVAAFEQLQQRHKTELKWRFLLQYFEVKLLIKKPAAMRKNLAIIVVDMQSVQLDQLIEKVAVF